MKRRRCRAKLAVIPARGRSHTQRKQKMREYDTQGSQVITDLSTN